VAFEDELGYLYGFTRLLLPSAEQAIDRSGLGVGTALIRELHVYGKLASLSDAVAHTKQHKGIGRRLMQRAERISAHQ
jgi:elongator complex protein 3